MLERSIWKYHKIQWSWIILQSLADKRPAFMTISKNFHVVSLLRYLDRLLFGLEIIEVSIQIFSCYLDMCYLEK